MYIGTSGCDYHRIKLPFIFAADYFDNDFFSEKLGQFHTSRMLEFLEASDLIVLNRLFPIGTDKLIEYKNKFGFKVALDLDDWFVLPDYHPNFKQYKTTASKQIIQSLQLADLVTVTTDRLYKRVREINPNCHVVPNALPCGQIQFRPQPAWMRGPDFDFIYAGQSSHLEDVRILQAHIKRASRLPAVSFTLAGYKADGSATARKVWHGIEQVFRQGAPYTRIPNKPLAEYMSVYDNADCSLVPLCINDFNSCKSNLKILEAACKKIPVIVSHVPPYRDDHDAPVLWVKEPNDWYKHIKYLSENRSAAVAMGEQLHQWANEKYNFWKINRMRFELYQSILP